MGVFYDPLTIDSGDWWDTGYDPYAAPEEQLRAQARSFATWLRARGAL